MGSWLPWRKLAAATPDRSTSPSWPKCSGLRSPTFCPVAHNHSYPARLCDFAWFVLTRVCHGDNSLPT